ELAAAQAALSSSRGDLSRNRALVDATTIASQPQVQAAAAQLRSAYLALQRASIVAPVTGYVAQRHVQLGQRVQPGATLMTVVPLEQAWVEANFKETQLAKMRLGQPVTLTSDVYGDDVEYTGRLSSLGMGTGSAFSLLPAQNASGNWIKIVQRVPVRIELDPKQLAEHPLRLGMSMSVDVDLHDQDGGVLPQAAPARPVLATDAYAKQLSEADALIREIVQANLARDSRPASMAASPTTAANMPGFRPPSLALATIGLALASFMQVLDTTIANVSLPAISGNLGASANQATWVITSFAVSNAIALPLTGFMVRRYGERKLFMWATLAFVVASFLCGIANSMGLLVVARALQGFVAGPMYPVTQALLISIYPPHKRGQAIALLAMVTVVAPIAGPILGGWITDNYSWEWIFFI